MEKKAKWGSVGEQIMKLLEELGPLTRSEVCEHLGVERGAAAAILTRLCKETPMRPKRAHIAGYTYDTEGLRRYPRALYAAGNRPDKKKPKSQPSENRKRYRQKLRKQMTMNSVFNMGLTRREYEAIRKQHDQFKEAA